MRSKNHVIIFRVIVILLLMISSATAVPYVQSIPTRKAVKKVEQNKTTLQGIDIPSEEKIAEMVKKVKLLIDNERFAKIKRLITQKLEKDNIWNTNISVMLGKLKNALLNGHVKKVSKEKLNEYLEKTVTAVNQFLIEGVSQYAEIIATIIFLILLLITTPIYLTPLYIIGVPVVAITLATIAALLGILLDPFTAAIISLSSFLWPTTLAAIITAAIYLILKSIEESNIFSNKKCNI